MLRHVRLNKHGAALGIKASCEPIEQHLNRVLLYLRGVRVVRRERMPVSNKEKALILVLHAHPVLQRPDVIAEVQLARRTHAAKNAFAGIRHARYKTVSNNDKTGLSSRETKLPPK